MKTLTHSALRDMLYSIRGSTPVVISALTPVRLPKRAGIAGEVLKLARVQGLTATNILAAMARKVDGYVPKPRQWGHRLSPALVENANGKMYLSIRVQHRYAVIYLARHGSLLKTIRERDIAEHLRKPSPSPIEVRDYSLANIKRISIAGSRYRVVPDGTES